VNILLDDLRDLPEMDIIFRSAEVAQWCWPQSLNTFHLFLDHDLGENKRTGYDFLKLFYLAPSGTMGCWDDTFTHWPDKVTIVSANPVGRENIRNLLTQMRYTQEFVPPLYDEVWSREHQ